MPRLIKKFNQAVILRQKGYSINEISQKLSISKSTASSWLKSVSLSKSALKRLEQRSLIGHLNSCRTKRRIQEQFRSEALKQSKNLVNRIKIDDGYLKILCAMLFECEGTKSARGGMRFTNSSPLLVKSFLSFFRQSFNVDEKKFRVLLHLHDYHSEKKQIIFWSKVTNIPVSQFSKSYKKLHTGKRYRNGYPGCASIRYLDSKVAKKLSILSEVVLEKYGSVR